MGREHELCKAEVLSVVKKLVSNYTIVLDKKDVLIIEFEAGEIDINKLGGTIKLFSILESEIARENLQNFIQSITPAQTEKRINFGISGYGRIDQKLIYSLGKRLKDHFIEMDCSARFVTGKFNDLSSVIVHENKLIERGFELILIEQNGKFIIGQTVAVQDYKAYSKRDFGRPKRDDKNGMLPPKLAQMMINLAEKPTVSSLYDPFCGSGTILQEGLIMGFQNIYGSDIEKSNIDDTNENLIWVESRFGIQKTNIETFVSDVLKPDRELLVDAVVAEGYLGEPARRNVEKAKNDARELGDFYLKALSNLAKMLNNDGRMILAMPYFIIGKERVFLPITDKLTLIGLKIVKLSNVNMTPRDSLLYARPDSFVGREIFVFEKN